MARMTKKFLIEAIKKINSHLAEYGCTEFLSVNPRDGYCAIDIYRVDAQGIMHCQRLLESGTIRECYNNARAFKYYSLYKTLKNPVTLSRKQVKVVCIIFGICFDKDFHELSSFECDLLVKFARKTKYRKPKDANGSTARYFYYHLKNRVIISHNLPIEF